MDGGGDGDDDDDVGNVVRAQVFGGAVQDAAALLLEEGAALHRARARLHAGASRVHGNRSLLAAALLRQSLRRRARALSSRRQRCQYEAPPPSLLSFAVVE